MLVFIENTPRAYAWGSRDALPELLGTAPTGEPQAELWLGAHPGGPATVAKGSPKPSTLIELIERDPEAYGVDGGQLPFLLKVLAIGAPLSLQVHPDRSQAEAGFDAEEAAGVPRDAKERNYGDRNHKPELLVALSEVTALCGFRSLEAARADLEALAEAVDPGAERDALLAAVGRCGGEAPGGGGSDAANGVRRSFVCWALDGLDDESGAGGDGDHGGETVRRAVRAIGRAARRSPEGLEDRIGADRLEGLRQLTAAHPDDPGVLVSLLLHQVRLKPGEAVYLGARQLHAYLSGIGVEVMAASDNVLRAGLTEKHIDVAELLSIIDTGELADPRFSPRPIAQGIVAYEPGVPDFRMLRVRLHDSDRQEGGDSAFGAADADDAAGGEDRAASARIEARYPLVLIVTSGRVRAERPEADFGEVASVGRGQSLYVSAGQPLELSGCGEAFIATVGDSWPSAC